MGLWSATKALATGNFRQAADSVFVDEDEINRGISLDSRLIAEVQSDHARGALTDEQANFQIGRLQASATDKQIEQASPSSGFVEGWKEGYNNVKNTIQGATSGLFGGILGLIPWQVYVGAGIFAVIYFWPVIRPLIGPLIGRFVKK